jgi:hypothetical protein
VFALRIHSDDRSIFETDGTANPSPRGAYLLTAAQVPPGTYLVRMGAADRLRHGTIELPLNARLNEFGKVRVSDVILGSASEGFRPAISLARGQRLAALVEAYGRDASDFDGLAAVVELRRVGIDKPLASTPAGISHSADPTRRVAEADLPTEGLDPGLYSVTVQMRERSVDLGTISRQIRIE